MWRTCIYLGQLGALGWDAHGGRDDRHTKRPAGASEQASWHQKAGLGHLHACRVREVARGHMESTWQQVGSARPPRRPHGQNTASAPAPACVGQPSRRLAGCRAACRPRAVLQERATATIEKDGALGWIGETGIIRETAIAQMPDRVLQRTPIGAVADACTFTWPAALGRVRGCRGTFPMQPHSITQPPARARYPTRISGAAGWAGPAAHAPPRASRPQLSCPGGLSSP